MVENDCEGGQGGADTEVESEEGALEFAPPTATGETAPADEWDTYHRLTRKTDESVLEWWKKSEGQLPRLAKVA